MNISETIFLFVPIRSYHVVMKLKVPLISNLGFLIQVTYTLCAQVFLGSTDTCNNLLC